MLNQSAKYTANTGMGLLTTTNTGLDGGGAVVTIITGASNGTVIKSLTVKGLDALCSGNMVRIYVQDDGDDDPKIFLLDEILIRPTGGGISSKFAAYSVRIPMHFTLKAGYLLRASVNSTTKITVVAEGLNWTY